MTLLETLQDETMEDFDDLLLNNNSPDTRQAY